MKLFRHAARQALLVIALVGMTALAHAQTFPDHPIKFILGFGAGGPTDIIARTLADQLGKELGERVVVENRTGAAGNLATQAVASADPDGYTFLIAASPLAVNETLYTDFPVKFGRDIVAVAPVGATANVLVVNPARNVRSVAELVALAKTRPDAVSYATVGVGSSSHLAGIAFDLRAGTKMLPISYRGGGEALKDLLGGRVDAWFGPISSVLGAVRDGQLVALATTGPQRVASLPDVPTMAEQGFPDFDIRLWVGVFARPETPPNILRIMEVSTAKVLAAPELQAALDTQGITPLPFNRSQFNAFVAQEVETWKPVVAAMKK